jgi:hypothetical protein
MRTKRHTKGTKRRQTGPQDAPWGLPDVNMPCVHPGTLSWIHAKTFQAPVCSLWIHMNSMLRCGFALWIRPDGLYFAQQWIHRWIHVTALLRCGFGQWIRISWHLHWWVHILSLFRCGFGQWVHPLATTTGSSRQHAARAAWGSPVVANSQISDPYDRPKPHRDLGFPWIHPLTHACPEWVHRAQTVN